MKKHKSLKQSQDNIANGTAEVFVLPPELLAKLGINLNIQHSASEFPSTSITKGIEQSVNDDTSNLPEHLDASSIIQTANLMKESVFLSPTFFQTAPIPGPEDEEPIVNKDTTITLNIPSMSEKCKESSMIDTVLNSVGMESASQVLNESIIIKSGTGRPLNEVNNAEACESITEYQVENHGGDLILTNIINQSIEEEKKPSTDNVNLESYKSLESQNDYHNENVILKPCNLPARNSNASTEKSNAVIVFDENPDKAESLDSRESNLELFHLCGNNEKDVQNILHDNKINEKSANIVIHSLQLKNTEDSNMNVINSTDVEHTSVTENPLQKDICGTAVTNTTTNKTTATVNTQSIIIKESTSMVKNFDSVNNILAENMVTSCLSYHDKEFTRTKIPSSNQHTLTLVDENCAYDNTKDIPLDDEMKAYNSDKQNIICANDVLNGDTENIDTELVSITDNQDSDKRVHINSALMLNCDTNFRTFNTHCDENKSVENAIIKMEIPHVTTNNPRNLCSDSSGPSQEDAELITKFTATRELLQKPITIVSNAKNNLDSFKEHESLKNNKKCAYTSDVTPEIKGTINSDPKIVTHEKMNKKVTLLPNSLNTKEAFQEAELICTEKTNFEGFETVGHDMKTLQTMNKSSNITSPTTHKAVNNITDDKIDNQDKVKEIAAYLNQIATERNTISRKRHINKATKRGPIISKLCVQGVEKPGGNFIQSDKMESVITVSKTYQKARKPKSKTIKISDAILSSNSFQIANNENCNSNSLLDLPMLTSITHGNYFCICHDFGNLAHYDREMLFEHIHFCSHKSVEYDTETIFSIYEESDPVYKRDVDFIEDIQHISYDNDTKMQDSLCWNEIDIPDTQNEVYQLLVSESEQFEKHSLANPQSEKNKLEVKPKEKSIDAKIKVKDPQIKKIKCEICNKLVKEMEWKIHEEKEHNSTLQVNKKLNATQVAPEKSNDNSMLSSIEITVKSNQSNMNLPTISNNVSASEVVSQCTKKSTDLTIDKCSKSRKTSLNIENNVSDDDIPRDSSSQRRSDRNKRNCKERARSTRRSSRNTVSGFDSLPSKSNKPAKQDASVSKSDEANVEVPKTRKRSLKVFNDSVKSIDREKPAETNKISKTKQGANENQGDPVDGQSFNAMDIRNYLESSKTDTSNVEDSTEKTQTQSNIKTSKRTSNSKMISLPEKKLKTVSSINIEVDLTNKNPAAEEPNLNSVKLEHSSRPNDPEVFQKPRILGENETVNTTLQDETMDIYVEISATSYDNSNVTLEDTAMDTFSSDVSMSNSQSVDNSNELHGQTPDEFTKCGVCERSVEKSLWLEHRAKEHNYLAWCDGETPLDLDDELDIKRHLQGISNQLGRLTCSKCGLLRKHPKQFLRHINSCNGEESKNESQEILLIDTPRHSSNKSVLPPYTCGVCNETVEQSAWIEHIANKHKYLAWTTDEQPLDLDNDDDVKQHLNYISKHHGGLLCHICGAKWSYVKKYLNHINNCTKNESQEVPLIDTPRQSFKKSELPYTCGVCNETVDQSAWIAHITNKHKYLAWTTDEQPLDLGNEEDVKQHLKYISKKYGGLQCHYCGAKWNYVNKYLNHINDCTKNEYQEVPLIDTPRQSFKKSELPYTCGVCNETVDQSAWIAHITNKHKYLAWTTDEQPLDLGNEEDVKQHLKYISKKYGGLQCHYCGAKWNYVKKYLNHINDCRRVAERKGIKIEHKELDLPPVVTCGICKLEVEGKNWIKHIQVAHQYMAWIMGEPPVNIEDSLQVKEHLDKIVRATGGLVCGACGEIRKWANAYLQHVTACAKSGFQIDVIETPDHDETMFTCGVCREKGDRKDWTSHAMLKHYNIAWMVGETPVNTKNPYAIQKLMQAYGKKYNFVCQHCKLNRASWYGFYAHILTCGKTEKEIEALHEECEVCGKKVLCIYRNQHMASHRDSEMRRERREMLAQHADEKAAEAEAEPPSGKRKAAEKAKKDIMQHVSNTINNVPVCRCGATFKDIKEYSEHSCAQKNAKDKDDDSDVSVKLEDGSDESADEFVDSGESDEEENNDKSRKRIRIGEGSTKVQRMPYKITNYSAYLSRAYHDFVALHYTSDNLYDEWRNSEYSVVAAEETAKYLPQVMESCKVRFDSSPDDEWTTYKRFEGKKEKVHGLFTGGAIQCISWAPHNVGDETQNNYLAVSCHRGPDVPRLSATDLAQYPSSLQIWDCGLFQMPPKCAVCIAHDYGLVWAMDWCPSGARDPSVETSKKENSVQPRLGLLAIACSNGTAYILAVPRPSENEENIPVVYTMKPVAELRLCMTSQRRIYQATSIKWSPQKGHSIIMVGYSNGTTALYDLNTESPFLTVKENGATVYYPFQDKHSETSSVTSVGVLATANESYPVGAQYSTSMTGSSLVGAAARPSARLHFAVSGSGAAPHWPAVTLSGDVPFMRAVSEMEWWGGGRRAGAARAWAACARCGRTAAAASPALRAHRHHPIYPDIKKLIKAMLLMVPLGARKKKRKVNDDLSVVVEPLTYEDAVSKYGLELNIITKTTRPEQIKAQQICLDEDFRPERFPLSEMVAIAFCPSGRFHDRIAVATHAGVIFIIHI